jgi:hypothetical protein
MLNKMQVAVIASIIALLPGSKYREGRPEGTADKLR